MHLKKIHQLEKVLFILDQFYVPFEYAICGMATEGDVFEAVMTRCALQVDEVGLATATMPTVVRSKQPFTSTRVSTVVRSLAGVRQRNVGIALYQKINERRYLRIFGHSETTTCKMHTSAIG